MNMREIRLRMSQNAFLYWQRPLEEIRREVRAALGVEGPPEVEFDYAEVEESCIDHMKNVAFDYAQAKETREALRAARISPKGTLQHLQAESDNAYRLLLEMEAGGDDEAVEILAEYRREIGFQEHMHMLVGPEFKRAVKALAEARAALEALPEPVSYFVQVELWKRPARPLLLRLSRLFECLAEGGTEDRAEDTGWQPPGWTEAKREALHAAYFRLEGKGGILEGMEAVQRILAGRFGPGRGKAAPETGRAREGVQELVAAFCASAFLLLGRTPTQGQVNNLLRIFINDPNPNRYLSAIKRCLAEYRRRPWEEGGRGAEAAPTP